MANTNHDSDGVADPTQPASVGLPIIGPSRRHLQEAEMGYWPHLTHAFHQSNRLLVVVVKSYIHGVFPLWFKADGPKTIIRIYHEIRRIRHIDRMARQMERDMGA